MKSIRDYISEGFYKNVVPNNWIKNCHEIMHMIMSNQYNSTICPDELIEQSRIFYDEEEMYIELKYKNIRSYRCVRFDFKDKHNVEELINIDITDKIERIMTYTAISKKTGLEEIVSLDIEYRENGHIKSICLKPAKEL